MILFLAALLIVTALLGTAGVLCGVAYGPTVLLMLLAGPITTALAWALNIGGARCDDYDGR